MRHHRTLTASAALTLALVVALPAAWATPGSGMLPEPLVTANVPDGMDATSRTDDWKARLDIKGSTDVRTVKYTVALGWHSHNAFNRGAVELVLYATHLMPAGMPTRIDQPTADC